MKNGVFYNMFRNGDLFLTREFAKSMMKQVPEFQWFYAHGNHSDSLKDLPSTYIPMPHHWEVCMSNKCISHDTSDLLPSKKPLHEYEIVRCLSDKSPMYINTWAGCFYNVHFKPTTYPNMNEFLAIWNDIGARVGNVVNRKIQFSDDIINYFPTIDESQFDTNSANEFYKNLRNAGYKNCVLFANGKSMSGQSKLESMDNAIINLSKRFKRTAMIVTNPIHTTQDNIFFTQNIFNKEFDLPEISLLSSFCNIIVGKNSGPFTYAHTKNNVLDRNKTFVSFSNLSRDNLLHEVSSLCNFMHSSTTDEGEVELILHDIIKQKYE